MHLRSEYYGRRYELLKMVGNIQTRMEWYRRLLSSLGGRLACCRNGSNFVVVAKVEVKVGAAVAVAFEVEVEAGSGDRR